MTVGDACNREIVIVEKNEPVSEAIHLMRKYHVGDVVVIERQGQNIVPIGILTDRDIVVEILTKGVDLDKVNIGDVMSFNLVAVQDTADLADAIKLMQHKGVRRLPVINSDGHAIGILAMDNVLMLLAEQFNGIAGLIASGQNRERMIRR